MAKTYQSIAVFTTTVGLISTWPGNPAWPLPGPSGHVVDVTVGATFRVPAAASPVPWVTVVFIVVTWADPLMRYPMVIVPALPLGILLLCGAPVERRLPGALAVLVARLGWPPQR